jgi:hypothetical protein
VFNVVVRCVLRFFLFYSVDVEDSGLLGCYTDVTLVSDVSKEPLNIKSLRSLETSRNTNSEIQGHISQDLNPLPNIFR